MHNPLLTRIKLCVLAVVLFTAGAAQAQEPLTLDDAIARALQQNPAVRGAQAGEREAAERTRQAKAGWLPRVDVTETWQRGNQPVYVFGSLLAQRHFTQDDFQLDALNNPDPLNNFRTGISVEQTVFNGVRTRAAVRSASIAQEISQVGSRDVASTIRVGVTQAYGQVLMAQTQRSAAASALASAEEDVRRVERRRDTGMANEADVLALKLHLALVRERSISAASQEMVARIRLNELLGEPLDRSFQLQLSAVPPQPIPPIAELENEALRERPDALRASAQERLAREAITMARGSYYPQAAIQGGYEFNGGSFADRASAWTFGAVFRWNLFAGLSDSSRVAEAKAALERVSAERERQETQVRVDVRTAVSRVDEARAREEVGRSAFAQAQESRRIVRDRYEAGLASINDLLRSANAVLEAESQHTAATVDVLVSAAMLERARGR